MSNKLPLERLAAWKERGTSYYLYASPASPGGRVIVLTAIGPEGEHRWVVLPRGGPAAADLANRWADASDEERTRLAEELLRGAQPA